MINKNSKIFIAGHNGMVGSAIFRNLLNSGYGRRELGGEILRPSRQDLDLANYESLNKWFLKNKPTVTSLN